MVKRERLIRIIMAAAITMSFAACDGASDSTKAAPEETDVKSAEDVAWGAEGELQTEKVI